MKTIDYIAKSNPSIGVKNIPAGIGRKAEKIVDIADKGVKTIPELSRLFGENTFLLKSRLLHAYSALEQAKPDNPDYLKLQDKLYFMICKYYNKQRIYDSDGKRKTDEEAKEAEKLDKDIFWAFFQLK